MSKISQSYRNEVLLRNVWVVCPTTDQSHEREEQEHVAHLEGEREGLWRDNGGKRGGIGELADVVGIWVHEVDNIGPDKERGLDDPKEDERQCWED